MQPIHTWTLSPSDLTFLWEQCPLCFYNKVARGIIGPRVPMPAVFNKIDSAMKGCYLHQRTESIDLSLPPGEIMLADGWVKSIPLPVPGTLTRVVLQGRYDTMARFDDGTWAVLDFKTSKPGSHSAALYSRQLHAYAIAVEQPACGRVETAPVNRLGLLYFQPQRFVRRPGASGGITGYFGGAVHWQEIQRDDDAFLTFLSTVVSLLDQPCPPLPSATCGLCQYSHNIGLLSRTA